MNIVVHLIGAWFELIHRVKMEDAFVSFVSGVAIGVPVFTKLFKLHDTTIMVISFVDKIISNIIMALVITGSMFYAGNYRKLQG